MLHIINRSPLSSNALASCLRLAKPGSTILLIEDGVYAALVDNNSGATLLHKTSHALKFCALTEDLKARGLMNRVLPFVTLVDYNGFVALTEKHSPIQTWS